MLFTSLTGFLCSAYMLAAGAFGPLYGKLSNMFGRKPILYASIVIFLVTIALLCSSLRSHNRHAGRFCIVRCGTKHDMVDRLQSSPRYRRRWYHSARNYHHLRYSALERVSACRFRTVPALIISQPRAIRWTYWCYLWSCQVGIF